MKNDNKLIMLLYENTNLMKAFRISISVISTVFLINLLPEEFHPIPSEHQFHPQLINHQTEDHLFPVEY